MQIMYPSPCSVIATEFEGPTGLHLGTALASVDSSPAPSICETSVNMLFDPGIRSYRSIVRMCCYIYGHIGMLPCLKIRAEDI